MAFQLALLRAEALQLIDFFLGLRLEHLTHLVEDAFISFDIVVGAGASQGFNAAHAGADAAFGGDGEKADFTRGPDVGTTAQFFAKSRHFDGADVVAVFFTKQGHRTAGEGVIQAGDLGLHGGVVPQLFVYQEFNALQFTLAQARKMGKVKPQAIRGDEGTGLFDVIAQDLPQGGVQEVGGGVILANFFAPLLVNAQLQGHARLHAAAFDHAGMNDEIRQRFLGIGDVDLDPVVRGQEHAAVAHLTAGFAVKRGSGKDDVHRLPGVGALDFTPVGDQGGDGTGRLILVVA